jgi:hypothetical protein
MRIIIFLALLFSLGCKHDHRVLSDVWDDGSLKVTSVQDSIVGKHKMLFIFYHKRGTTDPSIYFKEEVYYQTEPVHHFARRKFFNKNGERDSTWIGFFINGQKSSVIHYKDGKAHGSWRTWLPDGSVSEKIEYYEDSVISID